MKTLRGILFVASICIMASCGGGSSSNSCSSLNARIFNGDSCDQGARTPVVAIFPIRDDGSQFSIAGICSGTLVTVNDILTSAHCIIDPIIDHGEAIVGFAALVGGSDGDGFPVVNGAIHPQYDGRTGSRYDIAMLTLSEVPSPPIGPIPVALSEATAAGSRITAYGYGTNNDGEVGELKAASFTVDALLEGNLIVTKSSAGASVCRGDSGGPAVTTINGVTALAGVNSFASRDGCVSEASKIQGFVDLQSRSILDFIFGYAPDIPAQ